MRSVINGRDEGSLVLEEVEGGRIHVYIGGGDDGQTVGPDSVVMDSQDLRLAATYFRQAALMLEAMAKRGSGAE